MSGPLDGAPLVDHHCHGISIAALSGEEFESLLTEADAPGPGHGSLFDTQAGLGVRAVCAPLLDLPAFAQPAEYLARRAELGGAEVARRMLRAAAIAEYLVDTGFAAATLTSPAQLAGYTGARAREIVRLESVAEQLIATVAPAQFPDALGAEVTRRAGAAAGFKSIAAYRVGLDLDPHRPQPARVIEAAAAWQRQLAGDQPPRLTDATIIRHLLWIAFDLGGPVQFHVGFGDAQTLMDRGDPLLLMPLLRATAGRGAPIMLLHNYPFHRHAGYLAQVFDHVFVDVGLTLHNVGSRAPAVLAELLELAPFGSVLFSSDAFGLAELYALHARLFRDALGAFLDNGIGRGCWSVADAERIATMIAAGNARRAYRLEGE